jgi:hypothetical protein
MNPIEWLDQKVHGFAQLPEADRTAILHFSLLWSLFEAKALQTDASARKILSLVNEWSAQGRLKAQGFEPSLDYFRQRYFQEGTATTYFDGLRLRKGDNPDLVCEVLRGNNNNPVDAVAVVLIVTYRLRNNLFHGTKWAYGIQDQRSNFERANEALMSALAHVDLNGA